MRFLALILGVLAGPLAAQDLPYSDARTLQCLQHAGEEYAPRECIGASAGVCMETAIGGTTVGMGGCLNAELELWDRMLNANYRNAMALAKQADIDSGQAQYNLPSQADALRDMQRAWIPFRDASCDYARSQWQGGTGGGPATLSCLLELTGQQAIALERLN